MKADEEVLAKGLLLLGAYNEQRRTVDIAHMVSPRSLIADAGIPPNRGRYILEKWGRKGWYEYGVTVDMGWLTPKGVGAFADLEPPPKIDPQAPTGEDT